MRNSLFLQISVAGVFIVLSITPLHSAMPVWKFSAPNPATVTVGPGETATVQYTVTNQSLKSKNLLLKPTPGLSASSCILPGKGSTCVLTLTANGSQIPAAGLHTGPSLCDQGNLNQCYQPSLNNQIQVNSRNSVIVPIYFSTIGYYDNGTILAPLAYTSIDGGSTWRLSSTLPAPVPATTDNILQGISCDSLGNCAAAGNYTDGGILYPLTYSSSDHGINWNISSTLPSLQGLSTPLNAISCNASGYCATAGSWDFLGTPSAAVYISNDHGVTWATGAVFTPFLGYENILSGMSCMNSGSCVTVGYQDDGVNGRQPMFATSSSPGANWMFSSLVSNAVFLGVSCDNSGNCAAVGTTTSSPQLSIVYTSSDSGLNWSIVPPLPQVGGGDNSLVSISCLDSGQCAAVGLYTNGGIPTPLAYISNDSGVTWSLSTVLPPAQGNGANRMRSISCLSTGLCSAVGIYTIGATDYPLTYTSRDYGDIWALSTTLPSPQGNGDNALNGVS